MTRPTIGIVTYISASPHKVWEALANPEITHHYWFGTRFESDWKGRFTNHLASRRKDHRPADPTQIGTAASIELYVSSGHQRRISPRTAVEGDS
jgi:hypothetical protein